MFNDIILVWRKDLKKVLSYYEKRITKTDYYFIYLFIFFIIINITCYWFAMLSAFPSLVFGSTFDYYFKVQFPVGIFGALFDSLSLFITILIIKRALLTIDDRIYIAHLSIDVIIAIMATFWVILVFIVSGWIVSALENIGQSDALINAYNHETNINKRTAQYFNTVNDALLNPSKNIANIYFGIIMGLSAMIPTIIHFAMFCKAIINSIITNHNKLEKVKCC